MNGVRIPPAVLSSLSKAVVAMLIGAAVIYVASNNIIKQVSQIQQQRIALRVLDRRYNTAASLRQELSQLGPNEDRIKKAFLPVENIPDFISALESVARQSSINQTVKFGTPTPFPHPELQLSTIDFDVALAGTVDMFRNYLKTYQQLPYLTEIVSLTLTSTSRLGWDESATISFRARLYTGSLQET
ncbi:MAG: hypothetical protein HYY50_04250 [Candidatus Kerfeldbacteria bacterium]|nr:hypothetical protein [Candidatus Kerfeldbacteria bacterium]